MQACNAGERLASQQVKAGPSKEAWWKEEVKFEIERLKVLLRDPLLSEEERAIAQAQIANYQEAAASDSRSSADWLHQMYLLAD